MRLLFRFFRWFLWNTLIGEICYDLYEAYNRRRINRELHKKLTRRLKEVRAFEAQAKHIEEITERRKQALKELED